MNKNLYLAGYHIKWFFIWALIYTFLLWILRIGVTKLSLDYSFLSNKIVHVLILGFAISILSKLIYCSIKKKTFYFNVKVFYWWIIFSLLLLFINFLLNLILPILSLELKESNIFFLLIEASFLSIFIGFLRRADFGSSNNHIRISEWIWWVIIVAGIIFLIQFYVPYGSPQPLSDSNLYCKDGKIFIYDDMFGLGKWVSEMEAGLTCLEYKSSRCRYTCDNGKPACQCETAIVHYLFTRKGEWIFGEW